MSNLEKPFGIVWTPQGGQPQWLSWWRTKAEARGVIRNLEDTASQRGALALYLVMPATNGLQTWMGTTMVSWHTLEGAV